MSNGGFQIDRPIALIGLMAAGKSTVGKLLAECLGWAFFDTDQEIERSIGLKVAEIFDRHGEPFFRERERELIHQLDLAIPRVIATGGGAFADESLRNRLLGGCITIWLDCPLSILSQRLTRSDERPLLRNSHPNVALERLASERLAFYSLADLHIKSGDSSPEELASQIVHALKRSRS